MRKSCTVIDEFKAESDVEVVWQREVERRATAIERGEAKWLDGLETLAVIKAEFALGN